MRQLFYHLCWIASSLCLMALTVTHVSCLGADSIRCSNGTQYWICPADMVCHDNHRCVTGIQIEKCVDKQELAPCSMPGVPHGSMRCRHKACVIPYCGDEVVDENEQCDGSNLGGTTCADLSYDIGTPACKEDCRGFVVDGCSTSGFIHVSKGTFTMGSPASEPCRETDETQHQVTLTHSFEMSAHETIQGEFESLMGFNPSVFSTCGEECPVDNVNWYQAAAYCNALSTRAGLEPCYTCDGSGTSVTCSEAPTYSGQKIYDCPGYRLPTEAEFEYAYRAGSNVALYPSAGNDGSITHCNSKDPNAEKIGWYAVNSGGTTHPVGQKAPNAWGFYDLAGNIWELCHDWYKEDLGTEDVTNPWGAPSGTYRILRGGAWLYEAHFMRAARRILNTLPGFSFSAYGFRPCRSKD